MRQDGLNKNKQANDAEKWADDDFKRANDVIQKLTDDAIARAKVMFEAKEKDLSTI